MSPRKWLRYPCIATLALSEIVCWLPSAGRIIGRAALDGTYLHIQPICKNYKYYGEKALVDAIGNQYFIIHGSRF